MTGLRKYPPAIDDQWANDLVDFLGGPTSAAQITTLKILLEGAGGALLNSWQAAGDLTKIDATKIYGVIPIGIISPLTGNLDLNGHHLLQLLAADVPSLDAAAIGSGNLAAARMATNVLAAFGNVTANYILAGPASGAAANPTLRAMVMADLLRLDFTKIPRGTSGLVIKAKGAGADPVYEAVDYYELTSVPSTFTPSAHGSAAHTGSIIPAADQNFQEQQALAFRVENLGGLPAAGNKGRLVLLTTDNKVYYDNGSSWVVF